MVELFGLTTPNSPGVSKIVISREIDTPLSEFNLLINNKNERRTKRNLS
jgi:hypothetical protein